MPILQLTIEEANELHSILDGYFFRTADGDRANRERRISRQAAKPRASCQEAA